MKEDDGEFKEIANVEGYDNDFKVKGLVPDKKYNFAVIAKNKAGSSDSTETKYPTVMKKKAVKPSAPLGPIIFSDIQKNSVVVAWQPSEDDGGSPFTGYYLEIRDKSKSTWSHCTTTKPDITSYCVQRLNIQQEYVFRVFAENTVGRSDALESNSVLIKSTFDVPSAPVGPMDVKDITKNSVTLSWQPSTLDGGTEITGYVVKHRDKRRQVWTKDGTVDKDTTIFTVNKLLEDNEYIFRVTAENAEGQSPPLESSAVKHCRTKDIPDAPETISIKDKTDTRVTLTWKPPKHDGGDKVQAYHIMMKEGDKDWKPVGRAKSLYSDFKVEDLSPGKPYKFSVVAENAIGKGPSIETTMVVVLKKKPGIFKTIPEEDENEDNDEQDNVNAEKISKYEGKDTVNADDDNDDNAVDDGEHAAAAAADDDEDDADEGDDADEDDDIEKIDKDETNDNLERKGYFDDDEHDDDYKGEIDNDETDLHEAIIIEEITKEDENNTSDDVDDTVFDEDDDEQVNDNVETISKYKGKDTFNDDENDDNVVGDADDADTADDEFAADDGDDGGYDDDVDTIDDGDDASYNDGGVENISDEKYADLLSAEHSAEYIENIDNVDDNVTSDDVEGTVCDEDDDNEVNEYTKKVNKGVGTSHDDDDENPIYFDDYDIEKKDKDEAYDNFDSGSSIGHLDKYQAKDKFRIDNDDNDNLPTIKFKSITERGKKSKKENTKRENSKQQQKT